ncbi:trehalose import ATP-binding protein SugC [bacterium BMS3Abin02]|nr:trehalose import ATP-binding protein SugC [bacterium BMS3Abin02]GBE22364.1 trehalose import ATP-binding protein SugC [bacterium BMS3Bbin01]HDH25003.1 sn-glycerol-3-phosphate ABC transporter ATP-binding protein UgpC [Actinomycetota bacterium]HDK46180.1 sn-glycerol-3-phosphate ABC transporter ATP-binding protein UgpC [Actinomycetota bacterium]
MAGIRFDQVGKVYPGGTRAIEDVSFDVGDGEFVVLVGPSGCGKSTLLRMVAGLEEITEGEVRIGDKVVNDVPPKDRDIAMVFQNYALYPHMSVFDNMAFGLKLRKLPKEEIKTRVEDAARTLEITDFLARKPKALSGGQRQRVAMGRAIVREPEAFLMDEPLSNLDAKLRVQMRSELGELHARLGTTTLYVTHDQVEAMTMGDRVAVIRKGTLQQVDTPRALYDHPVNIFVGGFIGSPSMNFVYGTLEGEGDKVFASFGVERLHIAPELLAQRPGLSRYVGKELVVGIRPEVFEMASAVPGAPEDQQLEVTVGLVEQLGSEAFVHFEMQVPPVVTPDIQELIADQGQDASVLGDLTKFTARVNPDTAPQLGEKVKLFIDSSKLHFFDRDTGAAIY